MSLISRSSALLFACLASCATSTPAGGVQGSLTDGSQARKSTNVISAEELHDPSVLQKDALQAIRQLRPMFFRATGPMSQGNSIAGHVQVSFDYGPPLSVSELASANTVNFAEVRYLDSSEAQLHFGFKSNAGPIILVLTHK